MSKWVQVVGGMAVALCAGCGGTKEPAPFGEGLGVKQSDVRIGLTADAGGPVGPVLTGEGFERLPSGSYVTLVENGGGRGTLNDADRAVASGLAEHSRELQGAVLARPGGDGRKSVAQVVQLTTTVLEATAESAQVRVMIDTELEPRLAGGGVAICTVEGEAVLDGHPMAKVASSYHLYAEEGAVAVYRGPRQPGTSSVARIENGARFKADDPSFFFKIGPGVYRLYFTLKLSATCPADQADSSASLKAVSEIGLGE